MWLRLRLRGCGTGASTQAGTGASALAGTADVKLRAIVEALVPIQGLEPYDFSKLWAEKQSQHMEGTREWAFAEIIEWLDSAPAADKATILFWLMGGGGTGDLG